MAVRVNAFAVDIDRTMTDDNLLLDLKAVKLVRALESKGLRVILVTGRNFCITGALAQLIGTCGYVVAENGGVIGRFSEKLKVLADVRLAKAGYEVLRERLGNRLVERADTRNGLRISDLSFERTFDAQEANAILTDAGVAARVIDTGVSLQLIDERVDKGVGLVELSKKMGIEPDAIIAIGDGYNDLDMFKKVGYRIAVGNAHEEVKRRADFVCKESYGAGFGEAIAHAARRHGLPRVSGPSQGLAFSS